MFRSFFAPLVGTLAAIFLIVLVTRVTGPIPLSISQTTTSKQSSFDVTGEGKVATSPDRAEISLGIQANEPTVKAVQDKGNQVINQITQDLQALGVDKADIKTTNYSLYPNYDYKSGSQKINGYALNVSLQVKAQDFSKITQIVDTATKDGANQVGGINFTLSDAKKKEIENQVRAEAVKEAKAKAESLSSLAGVRLGKIINISENATSDRIYPMPMSAKVMAVDAAGGESAGAPTNVEPGSTSYSMTVTLSYETL